MYYHVAESVQPKPKKSSTRTAEGERHAGPSSRKANASTKSRPVTAEPSDRSRTGSVVPEEPPLTISKKDRNAIIQGKVAHHLRILRGLGVDVESPSTDMGRQQSRDTMGKGKGRADEKNNSSDDEDDEEGFRAEKRDDRDEESSDDADDVSGGKGKGAIAPIEKSNDGDNEDDEDADGEDDDTHVDTQGVTASSKDVHPESTPRAESSDEDSDHTSRRVQRTYGSRQARTPAVAASSKDVDPESTPRAENHKDDSTNTPRRVRRTHRSRQARTPPADNTKKPAQSDGQHPVIPVVVSSETPQYVQDATEYLFGISDNSAWVGLVNLWVDLEAALVRLGKQVSR